jgi:hypothetical protein
LADAPPCATLSRSLEEPLYGTASRVRGWVLLEQPGPWGPEAVTSSRLDRELARALDRAAHDAHLRLLLIRRPGRGATRPYGCYVAHTSPADRWMEWRRLDDPAELLELDMAKVVAGQRPGFGEPAAGPVYLVCTNGRHDRCCATYGRPLALTLAARFGELIWESSHVGGDRFAGNLVCLPDGHYFGRVGPGDAERVVDRHRLGLLDLGHYRGRCTDPPTVQAAEWFARDRTGLLAVADLTPERRDRLGDGLEAIWFRRPGGGRLRLVVRASRSGDPRMLTCHSARPQPPLSFELLELAELPPSTGVGGPEVPP